MKQDQVALQINQESVLKKTSNMTISENDKKSDEIQRKIDQLELQVAEEEGKVKQRQNKTSSTTNLQSLIQIDNKNTLKNSQSFMQLTKESVVSHEAGKVESKEKSNDFYQNFNQGYNLAQQQ